MESIKTRFFEIFTLLWINCIFHLQGEKYDALINEALAQSSVVGSLMHCFNLIIPSPTKGQSVVQKIDFRNIFYRKKFLAALRRREINISWELNICFPLTSTYLSIYLQTFGIKKEMATKVLLFFPHENCKCWWCCLHFQLSNESLFREGKFEAVKNWSSPTLKLSHFLTMVSFECQQIVNLKRVCPIFYVIKS